VGDGPAQAIFLVDSTNGEATEVISHIPVGNYLIRLPAASEPPVEPGHLSFTVEGDELVLAVRSAQGFTYQLQHCTNPAAIAWTDLGDPLVGDGSILEFRQNIALTTAFELFQLRIDPSS
jgi:hypothetical protein